VASRTPGDPGGNRGAPPRGVDVKPLRQGRPGSPGEPRRGPGPGPEGPGDQVPGGPGRPRGLGSPPQGGGSPRGASGAGEPGFPVSGPRALRGFTSTPRAGLRDPQKGTFWPFSGKMPFLGFFRGFCPVATGLFFRKMAKNSHFWPKCPKKGFLAGIPQKRGFWGFSAPSEAWPRRGFTSTPRAGPPRCRGAAPAGPPPRAEGDPPVWGPRREPKRRQRAGWTAVASSPQTRYRELDHTGDEHQKKQNASSNPQLLLVHL